MRLFPFFRTGALAFALSSVASIASAAGFLYECDMKDAGSSKGWISAKMAIVVQADGTIKVVDGATMHFNKEPIEATILRDNARRLIVKWTIENAETDGGTTFANFDYRASIAKATGKIELTAVPRTFDAGLRSSGSCKKRAQ